jgi:hypothetical protein
MANYLTTILDPVTTPYPTTNAPATTLYAGTTIAQNVTTYLTTILDPATTPYNTTTPYPATTPYQGTTTASKITSYITTILDPETTPYATTSARPTYDQETTYGPETTYSEDATLAPLDDLGLDATLPPLDNIIDQEMSADAPTITMKPTARPQIKTTSVKIAAVTKSPSITTTRKQGIATPPKIINATLPRDQKNYPPIPAVYKNYPIYNFPDLKTKPSDGVFSAEDNGTAYEAPFLAVFGDGTWIIVSATQNDAESFGLIEGAEVIFSGNDPFPNAKSPITPVAQPAVPEKYGSNKITCAPSANRALIATTKPRVTERSAQQNKSSVLYVSDCVGYPISSAFFKNGSLIITLDTNDDSTLYSGYYKLVL